MKKTFTLAGLFITFMLVLAGCTRRGYDGGSDIDYWLSKENGYVVYSDAYCPFIVVETYNGYTIMRHSGGLAPYEGDEIFGDLSRRGYREFYNYTDYSEAQYIIDNLCYTYGKGTQVEKKQIKQGLYKKR